MRTSHAVWLRSTADTAMKLTTPALSCAGALKRCCSIAVHAVVLGNFDAAGLAGIARLQFASGSVQPVLVSADGTILVGTARVIAGNIPAANGVLHIINDVLDDDISLNSTAVAVAANAGDFGPFNQTQASLPSHVVPSV